ncbi:DUF1707 SHOCT-like domain-containing protein [Actinomadura hibisca]|uniref:DUF1707 SHOCT-like domain-containing protein n=1 Tax=Actinomadura hibisca TaxID=68565 RepID=UPI00082C371F|nr:DUF1707 domain-containing protein [Actinomadura hibisca]
MASNPEIRASDADRDRVAGNLQEHCAQGRITVDELHERLDAVYQARTLGQLEEITHDLPEEDLYTLPVPATQKSSSSSVAQLKEPGSLAKVGGQDLRAAWITWGVVGGINVGIWLILAVTGTVVYPWWLWVAGPWGLALILRTLLGNRD